jgi:CubicO group peptidase (beta-lactamase class C family)
MDERKLNALLTAAVTSGTVAGIAAALTNGRETIFQATAGTVAIGDQQPITPDTIFWIASMTKPITSVAALQLVEQGKLSLDEPIGNLLPDLANPQILENGTLRPAKQKITLRHLLTHTAGFGYAFANPALAAYAAAHPAKPGTLASLNTPLLFEPGTKWEYGINTDWVGRAVEAASGLRLDEYFTRHITGPLGMADTCFIPTAAQRARRAWPHQRARSGALTPTPPTYNEAPEFFSGGGGLFSTLADYQKFCRMILQDGASILSPASIAALSTNQVGALRAGVIGSANPDLMAGADPFPGMDSKWSFGFHLNPEPGPLGRSKNSLSWAGLANTYFWIDPAQDLAGIILMQLLPSGDLGAVKTYMQFEQAAYRR